MTRRATTIRAKGRASKATTDDLGAVAADEVLPLRVLRARLGLGQRAWATLRDSGLPVRTIAGQRFVLGADLLDHIRSLPADGEGGAE